MIPEMRLSTVQQPAALLLPDPQPSLTTARARGGVALNDASQGLNVQTWTITTDGTSVTIEGETVSPSVLFTGSGITEISLAFDQNMRPFVAFVDDEGAKYRWFDSLDSTTKITALPGAVTPRCCLDDFRPSQVNASDIILAYVREGLLHFRAQRDRYTIEYPLSQVATGLNFVGMGVNLRLQFSVSA